MKALHLTRAKQHGRKRRIWLAGAAVARAGLQQGDRYTVQYLPSRSTILITADAAGDRVVSGKQQPIIDLQNQQVEDMFTEGQRVQASFSDGCIIIEPHHEDTSRAKREQQFLQRAAAGQLEHASMFTGGGVSTEAIHDAIGSGRTAWIAELEHKYIESAAQNCMAIDDDTVLLEGAVEEIPGRCYTNVDVLSFSMPCTAHSKAGKAKHGRDSIEYGGTTVFAVAKAIQRSNPAIVVSENVPDAQGTAVYELLKCELERLGYVVFEQVLDSRHTDSIEQRARYWIVAFSKGIAPASFQLPEVKASGRQLRDVLVKAPAASWSKQDGLNAKAKRDAAAGKGFKRQLLTGSETRCGTIGRGYNKRRSTEPFLTRADGKERLLTLEEHAAVKSAPAHLVANLSATCGHEILGQSVDYRQPLTLMRAALAAASA